MMTPLQIAEFVHGQNRVLQQLTGGITSPEWADAPEWEKTSSVESVLDVMDGKTPEGLWESWRQSKLDDDWTWGEKKDPVKKTHPCLVDDYDSLPLAERIKDDMMVYSVRMLSNPEFLLDGHDDSNT